MVVLVAAISNTLSYTIRTNMSVTIVAMVNGTGLREINADNNSYIDTSDTCPYDENQIKENSDVSFHLIKIFLIDFFYFINFTVWGIYLVRNYARSYIRQFLLWIYRHKYKWSEFFC